LAADAEEPVQPIDLRGHSRSMQVKVEPNQVKVIETQEDDDLPVATEEKTEAKPKRAYTKKPNFDFKTAVDNNGNQITLDSNGRLTALPNNWDKGYQALRRLDFGNKALFYEWQARMCDARIVDLQAKKEEYLKDAEIERKGGDPNVKKMKKAAKMRKQLAALEEELKRLGIEV